MPKFTSMNTLKFKGRELESYALDYSLIQQWMYPQLLNQWGNDLTINSDRINRKEISGVITFQKVF